MSLRAKVCGSRSESPGETKEPYERLASAAWIREFDPETSGGQIRKDEIAIWAKCPHCKHQLDDLIYIDEIEGFEAFRDAVHSSEATIALSPTGADGTARRLDALTLEQQLEELTTVIACNCESAHEGRPETKLGCGRFCRVEVRLGRVGKEPTITLAPLVGTSDDKRWDEAAHEADVNALSQARQLAEKWTATLATLLTLFGVAALLGARDQLVEVEETYTWLGALAGAAAIVLGGLATLKAARAAQGQLEDVDVLTGDALRRLTRGEVDTVDQCLSSSKSLTVRAGLLGVLTALIIVLAPPRDPAATSKLFVVPRGGEAPVCGDVQSGTAGNIAITTEDSDTATEIAFDDVIAVSNVAECP